MPMTDENAVYTITVAGETIPVSPDQIRGMDIINPETNQFHLIHEHKSIEGKLIHSNHFGLQSTFEIEGEIYEVNIKTPLEQQLEAMGFANAATRLQTEIKAPMPGLVLSIHVQEGDSVKEGDKLLILEAMKMENSMLIHSDAVIKKILVKSGQAVEKNQVLIELANGKP